MSVLLHLYTTFLKIGALAFGGGYAVLPLIEQFVINENGWLTARELTDLISLSQMTPGPIAINASTFVGTKVAGLPGAVIATIGCVTPSFIIVLTLSYFYFKYKSMSSIQGVLKGLRPAVVSLIASAGISVLSLAIFKREGISLVNMNLSDINFISVIMVAVSVFILGKYKPDPIKVMVGTGIVGVIIYGLL